MAAVLARQRAGQLVQAVQLDPDGIVAEARQHVLAQQVDGARRHREDREQDGSEQAMADRNFQGRMKSWQRAILGQVAAPRPISIDGLSSSD
ncbi:hypothetical protein [Massilia sp. WF1]|uniref:hypothetical protein n=1 Tax=Massilia sp. WF1 TaxID=1406431 RepID=UPI0012E27F42|nr:hypothetical protein [Massilia sp. WF1]